MHCCLARLFILWEELLLNQVIRPVITYFPEGTNRTGFYFRWE